MTYDGTDPGSLAYIAGRCKTCLTEKQRAGGTECTECWKKRGDIEPGLERRPMKPKRRRR